MPFHSLPSFHTEGVSCGLPPLPAYLGTACLSAARPCSLPVCCPLQNTMHKTPLLALPAQRNRLAVPLYSRQGAETASAQPWLALWWQLAALAWCAGRAGRDSARGGRRAWVALAFDPLLLASQTPALSQHSSPVLQSVLASCLWKCRGFSGPDSAALCLSQGFSSYLAMMNKPPRHSWSSLW